MDEVEYNFVKGVGWVTGGKFVIVEHNGFRLKLEVRKPEPGEMFFNIDYVGEGWVVNGRPGPMAENHAKACFAVNRQVNMFDNRPGVCWITVTRL